MSDRRNRRLALGLAVVVPAMIGASYAAVPLYDLFCKVTGFGGTTNVAEAASETVLDEKVRVRFDSNVDSNMGWTFRPMQREMELRIGENAIAFYEAINNTDQPVTGTASYNVAPDAAGYFFNKIECFCFTEQTLQPGERVEMPVSFYVDPEMVTDRDAGRIRDITLSYTFHRTEPSAPKQAALETDGGSTTN